MSDSPTETTGKATIARVFDAPTELVRRCLTEPGHLPAEQYPVDLAELLPPAGL